MVKLEKLLIIHVQKPTTCHSGLWDLQKLREALAVSTGRSVEYWESHRDNSRQASHKKNGSKHRLPPEVEGPIKYFSTRIPTVRRPDHNGKSHKKTMHKNHSSQNAPDHRRRDDPIPQHMNAQAASRVPNQHRPMQQPPPMPQPPPMQQPAPMHAPSRQAMYGQQMNSSQDMYPAGRQQQQQYYSQPLPQLQQRQHQQHYHPQHYQQEQQQQHHPGYQRPRYGSELGGDEHLREPEAQEQGYQPAIERYMSNAPQPGSINPAAGMYEMPPRQMPMSPAYSMSSHSAARSEMGTPRPQGPPFTQGPYRAPSQNMYSPQHTPQAQGMGNMSLDLRPGPPSLSSGPPPKTPSVRRAPMPHRMQPGPAMTMDHHARQQAPPPIDSQFPIIHEGEILPTHPPSVLDLHSDSIPGTPMPQSPSQYHMPQPRVPLPPQVLSYDEMDSTYESVIYSPEMEKGPHDTFSEGYTDPRCGY